MTLILHRGAQPLEYGGLRELETPEPTSTHVPIPHFRVVDLVKTAVGMYGHEVVGEHFGVTEDSARFFGVLSLRSPYTGYEDMVALRNSHDRSFPVSVGVGSRVFCCDNMALIADQSIKRKHTLALKRDLPGLIGEMVEPLAIQREKQHRTFERYRRTELSPQIADHAILEMYKKGIMNIQRIPEVLKEWEEPTHEEWGGWTAWRMFNAATFVLTGRVMERPDATPRLHAIIDGVCEVVH
jgi:hypothetical protein